MIALVIALAAVSAPPAVLGHCRMMECSWSKPVSNVAVRSTAAGTLRKIVARRGTSLHRDGDPPADPATARIEWGKAATVSYAFCSRSRPAFAFRSGKRWIAHALDPFSLGGYNRASAVEYMRACHGLDFDRDDIEPAMRDLGYRPGTRSEQVEIARPEQLLDLPRRPKE